MPQAAQEEPKDTIDLTDPRALRALAHPIRLQLVALLRREGPLTATQAGEHLGESAASCSFHLRQLARYRLIEEAGGGRGRNRPWRATAQFTRWNLGPSAEAESAHAADHLAAVVARNYFDALNRWISRKRQETLDWQEAAVTGDMMLYLTPAELKDLGGRVWELAATYVERTANRELRPAGSRMVHFFDLAFPAV